MAIPTVAEVYSLAQALVGDPTGKVFTTTVLNSAFPIAFRRVKSEMLKRQIPRSKIVATHTFAAGLTSLTPEDAGISNFGELIRMEERLSGSIDKWTQLDDVDDLSDREQDNKLGQFAWYGDTWNFVGATSSRELRITYFESGAAPTSGSVGIDDSLNALAYLTAVIMAPWKGYNERAMELKPEAESELKDLLMPMVRSLQRSKIQAPAYSIERLIAKNVAVPYIAAPPMSGDAVPQRLTFIGTQDGLNATFTLSQLPQLLDLRMNGNALMPDVAYTRDGVVVTMLPGYIPVSTDLFEALAWV